MPDGPITYRDAGVDIDEAERATGRIKPLVAKTFNENVLRGIGSFGAAYSLGNLGMEEPVLISSADGVGTKLKVAFATGRHDTIGQDLVNHCVNDIAVQGATPLFFLDYFATGKLDAGVTESVVSGLAKACEENGCALIGGETAEMPGMYSDGEYDLAGFIVGAVDRAHLLDGSTIQEGDILIGLASNGLHTNGYSLARKLLFEVGGHAPNDAPRELAGRSVGDELLRVHTSYRKPLRTLSEAHLLRGAAHITGGGITDNTPRMLPDGLSARVHPGWWPVLPVFTLLERLGEIPRDEMFRSFNMGLGMIVTVPLACRNAAMGLLQAGGVDAYEVGSIVKGSGEVIYENA